MPARLAKISTASALCVALAANAALAMPAGSLQSLVGARGSSGESELEAKGFVSVDGHAGKSGMHTFWWNARDKNCVEVVTADGRYSSVRDAANSDCHQKGGGASAGAVAGAVVGAAVLAALVSHKGSHHDNNQHLSDAQAEQQYERGYNDGLHNVAYHNPNRLDAYSSGYTAGVDQRARNTTSHSGRGGYARHVSVSDLDGSDSIRAIDTMSARGFANVDSFSSGNTQYGIYWNRATQQCVQLTMADGRVYNAMELESNPKCR